MGVEAIGAMRLSTRDHNIGVSKGDIRRLDYGGQGGLRSWDLITSLNCELVRSPHCYTNFVCSTKLHTFVKSVIVTLRSFRSVAYEEGAL